MGSRALSWLNRNTDPEPAPRSAYASGNPPSVQLGITDEEFFEALRKNAGLIAQTAESLGCHYVTAWERAKRHQAKWDEIIAETRSKVCDIAEAHLITWINKGDQKAVNQFLRYHAKDRGYTVRHELAGPNGGAIPVAPVAVTITLVKSGEPEKDEP